MSSRFQALTNPVIDHDIDLVRSTLGLAASHKAELLGEMASISAWMVRLAAKGMTIEARSEKEVITCDMPVVARIRERRAASEGTIVLNSAEMKRLEKILSSPFRPTAGLKKALANLASSDRKPPEIRWKSKAR